MTLRPILLGGSALMLGVTAVTGTVVYSRNAGIDQAQTADSGQARAAFAKAQKALVKRKFEAAVKLAEKAVAAAPGNAQYRSLLGQSYLYAGRFTSATQALRDALTLDPGNGQAALNLALAQIGAGDWAGAHVTLNAYADRIPANNLGLAFALAGDPAKAVAILSDAVRRQDSTVTTRQNLALAFALGGSWMEARSIASLDLPEDKLNARLVQWQRMATPRNPYDQLAALLDIKPVKDEGQPAALALDNSHPPAVVTPQTQMAAASPPPPPPTPAADAAPPAAADPAPPPPPVAVAEVEPMPGPGVSAPVPDPDPTPAAPTRTAAQLRTARTAKGDFYVQLGAYANAAVAKDAWAKLTWRTPALKEHKPQSATVRTAAGSFYRLSIRGLARSDALSLCGTVRSHGGDCFVRQG